MTQIPGHTTGAPPATGSRAETRIETGPPTEIGAGLGAGGRTVTGGRAEPAGRTEIGGRTEPGGRTGPGGRTETPGRAGPVSAATAYKNIVDLLARKQWGRDSGVHPETRKTLERIVANLGVLDSDPVHTAADTERLEAILGAHEWLRDGKPPSEEQAWILSDSLTNYWIRTTSADAIDEQLGRFHDPAPPEGMTDQRKREWLLGQLAALQRAGSHERARSALRARYLRRAGGLLTVLVAAAWGVGLAISQERTAVTLCALAGAIGGGLSGARSLRDSSRIQETRVFQTWWWVQPLVGAAVGLFVYTLLASPVLTLPGSGDPDDVKRTAGRVVYAFIAGFSEPWLLGIVNRLGGSADSAATTVVSGQAAGGGTTASAGRGKGGNGGGRHAERRFRDRTRLRGQETEGFRSEAGQP